MLHSMKYIDIDIENFGKITAMPRKVYWIGMPESIKDKPRIELLKKDIWVSNVSPDEIHELQEEESIIVFVNLDLMIHGIRDKSLMPVASVTRKLLDSLSQLNALHTIIHTMHISPELNEMFTKASLTYIERNLYDVNTAISTIVKTVEYVYEKTNRKKREYLRIEINETNKIPIQGNLLKNNQKIRLSGDIADISLNGLQVILHDENLLDQIDLKDWVELSFELATHPIRIQKALVVRMNKPVKSIGVYFELDNEHMFRHESANLFSESTYLLLHEIIKKTPQ